MLRAALTVSSLTMVSRLSGFLRDVLIAAALGAGPAADAFLVSFKIANLFRRLFAEGAFSAGFVPLFARIRAESGDAAAGRFAQEALGLMLALMAALVLLAELFMPGFVRLVATGFVPGGERYVLAVSLSRITFPYLALISLAALIGAVLNALGRFAAAAATPILLNLVLIAALTLAAALGWTPSATLAWGLIAGGLLQLAWLGAAAARLGFGLWPRFRLPDPRLRRLVTLVLPGVGGAGLLQLMSVLNSWFASHLPTGAVAHLFYAFQLVQLPVGLVGAALATALLPVLSGDAALVTRRAVLGRSLRVAGLLALPATAGLILLAGPIVRVLFERGAFGPAAAAATAGCLQAMAVGLPAAVLAKVLAPAFFAAEDTATPLKLAGITLLAYVLLILLLVGPLGEAGIALAGSLAAWLDALLLAFCLHRRGQLPALPGLLWDAGRALAATLAMVILLVAAGPLLPTAWPESVLLLLRIVLGGLGLFLAAAGLGLLRDLAPALRWRTRET